MKQMKVNEQVRCMSMFEVCLYGQQKIDIFSLYLYMYIGEIFHIHVHVSSIWVQTKSNLSGSNGGATGSHVTGNDVTGSHVTRIFLNSLYDLACSGAVYD